MTTQAIHWVRAQQSLTPDRPFFVYFAPGAMHCPTTYRSPTSRSRPAAVRRGLGRSAAEDLAENQKRWGDSRRHEAGGQARRHQGLGGAHARRSGGSSPARRRSTPPTRYSRHRDRAPRRRDPGHLGQLENTMIVFIAGDNGTSAEGGMSGLYNEMSYFNGVQESVARHAPAARRVGRPQHLSPHGGGLGRGFGLTLHVDEAGRLQLRWDAQRDGHPLAPAIKAQGELRSQWHHVVDIAPTVLEAAGLPQPRTVNGVAQRPWKASAWRTPGTTRRLPTVTSCSTSRSWATADCTTTAGSPARSTCSPGRGEGTAAAPTSVGALRTRRGLQHVHGPRGRHPEKLEEMKGLFLSEVVEVQRPPHRRPPHFERFIAKAVRAAPTSWPSRLDDRLPGDEASWRTTSST